MLNKGVMLLGCAFSKRLEPMCVVCHAILLSPLHDAFGHSVGHGPFQTGAVVHHIHHLLIDIFWKILIHLLTIEDMLAEVFGRSFTGCSHAERLLLKSFTDNLESKFVCHNCVCV